jgi:GntR family transcriptional repressor for pyruvate dehydrogenase complex
MIEQVENELVFGPAGPKSRLVDRVTDEILRLISSGQLAPGRRLPPEREFAEQLGVSRPVLREAVHQLTAKGLLESRHGSGTTVREMTREAIVQPLGWLAHARGATLAHLHQVRSILEGEIVRLAAVQATDGEIAQLELILDEMKRGREQAALFVELDSEFHQALAQTTHNPLLVLLLDTVRDLMQEVRREVHRHSGIDETITQDHEAILAAISAHDPAAAAAALQRHLDHAYRFQQEFIATTDDSPLDAGADAEVSA